MSKPTTTLGSSNNSNLLTHAQYAPHLRQEAQLRRQTLATFGPQGVLDLALVGAILGNNIREIGRYSVTCDGCLVRGRYTIYELVHFGALAATGRGRRTSRRARRRGSVDSVASSTTTAGEAGGMGGVKKTDTRIFPTTLSNLFPAMVFKAMRGKSVRPPKFQHDDLDDNEDGIYSSMPTTPTIFPMSPLTATKPSLPEPTRDIRSHSHTSSFASSTTTTTSTATVTATTAVTVAAPADAMLITSEAVLSHLIQHRLHRVKDLPLPRELCFIGAVSLPLPPVLRAMHVAWTMDFLKVCATTPRRQRQQQHGGLEFRPDIYAHKMRIARLVRAQQQQQQEQKAGTSSSVAAPTPSTTTTTTTTPGSGYSHHRLSASMRRGPSSVSIPEENEDEDQPTSSSSNEVDIPPTPVTPLHLNKPTTPIPTPSTSSPTVTTAAKKSARQDKRLMQQLLTLENKVPRIVRQWANVARTCFEDELIQEDRQVQTWVDRQRIQVILGCGYRFGTSATSIAAAASTAATAAAPSLVASVTTAATATGTTAMMIPGARKITSATSSRPRLSPIATALANANASSNMTTTSRHQRIPSLSSSSSPAPRISCFPEGVRLGNAQQQQQQQQHLHQPQHQRKSTICSRPTSAIMNERLSASQQMLSMHLWLSLLVSPLSPEHMIQDQFGFLDS